MQEKTAGASVETGVRRAPEQLQFGPPPPSCPSPPLPSPLPEPDFTPPAVRAERNSHFAAADPAPTTAAASVTSGRRAAGPASRAAAAPRERLAAEGASRRPPVPHPRALPLSLAPHTALLPCQPQSAAPSALSLLCSPPKARAHEASPCGDIPLITKLRRSRALEVWSGCSLREGAIPAFDPRSPKHAAQWQRSALAAGVTAVFPSSNSHSWALSGPLRQ